MDPLGLARLRYYAIQNTNGTPNHWAFNIYKIGAAPTGSSSPWNSIKAGTELLYDKGGNFLNSAANPSRTANNFVTWNGTSSIMSNFRKYYANNYYSPLAGSSPGGINYEVTISDQAARIMIYGLTKSGGGKGDLTCTKLLTGAPLSSLLPGITVPVVPGSTPANRNWPYRAGETVGSVIFPVTLTANYTNNKSVSLQIGTNTVTINPSGLAIRITQGSSTLSGAQLTAEVARRRAQFQRLGVLIDRNGAPSAIWLSTLYDYAMSDFGAAMFRRVLAEYDDVVRRRLVDQNTGLLTTRGQNPANNPWSTQDPRVAQNQPYEPFKLISSTYGSTKNGRVGTGYTKYDFMLDSSGFAQLKAQAISFVDTPLNQYPGSGEQIFYMAVVHHEFGHSRYGDTGVNHTGVQIKPNGDATELFAVDAYENPVRLMYGYAPRYTYYNGTVLQGCSQYKTGSCP